MSTIDEVFENFAEILSEQKADKVDLNRIELLPNKVSSIQVETPVFLDSAIFSEAATEKEDVPVLKEKKKPKEPEDMIDKAHPESVYVSNALGDGGLVENQNEQHAKLLEVINKRPRGQHIHLHADMVEDLVKIANNLEDQGLKRRAFEIDKLVMSLFEDSKKKLVKEALLPALPALAWWGFAALLGSGAVSGAAAEFFGIQDKFSVDAKDFFDAVEDFPQDFPQSAELGRRIVTHARQMMSLSNQMEQLTSSGALSPASANAYSNAYKKFVQTIGKAQKDLALFAEREADSRILVPRAMNHLETLSDSFNRFASLLTREGQKYQQRARTQSDLPGYEEGQKYMQEGPGAPEPPKATETTEAPKEKKLSDQDKKAVIDFINRNYQAGTNAKNLQERLDDIAMELTKELGVRNITGDRLSKATALQLRRLFQLANNPGASIGYQPYIKDEKEPMATDLDIG